jgi:uncharacterized protein YkwD
MVNHICQLLAKRDNRPSRALAPSVPELEERMVLSGTPQATSLGALIAQVEGLMARQSVTAYLQNHRLNVIGTNGSDNIVVDLSGLHLKKGSVTGNIRVTAKGISKTLKANNLASISVEANAGNDTVTIQGDTLGSKVRIIVDGGAGDDVLNGPAGAVLVGGPGTNVINGVPDAPPSSPTAPISFPVYVIQPANPAQESVASLPAAPVQLAIPPFNAATEVQNMIDDVNAQRTAQGLTPLVINSALMDAAQIEADNMARLKTLSHDFSPPSVPSSQASLTARLVSVGYQFAGAGEDIAAGSTSASGAQMVTLWMDSPPHRANILTPGFTDVGAAIAVADDRSRYFCLDLAQPA